MLKAKAGRSQNWLPTQVAYGMDTSDPDPKNWKPFGSELERINAQLGNKKVTADVKPHE